MLDQMEEPYYIFRYMDNLPSAVTVAIRGPRTGCELPSPMLAVSSLELRHLHIAVEYEGRLGIVSMVGGRDGCNHSDSPENSLTSRRSRRSGLSCTVRTDLPTEVTPLPFPLLRELNLSLLKSFEGSVGNANTVPRASGSRLTPPAPVTCSRRGRPREFGPVSPNVHLLVTPFI
jgi:hypothetical protein